MRHDKSLKRLIPVTALRHLYNLLKVTSIGFRLEVAKEFVRKPSIVDCLVQTSSEHFACYENSSEGLHDRETSVLSSDQAASSIVSSGLLKKVESGRCVIRDHDDFNFDFVDYEVNPHRTTGSFYETGRSGRSSGSGGMDLLLANHVDQFPIVGEVKVATDKDPFFALVQALMYAVELTTESQRIRLNSAYGNQLRFPNAGPFVDLYLVLVSYPTDDTRKKLLKLTSQLGESLLVSGLSTSELVRRIVCIETDSVDVDELAFDVHFAHQVGGSWRLR